MNKKRRKFNLIIAGLDNIAARRWMNATLHDMVDRTSGEPDPSSLDAMMATRVIWREKPRLVGTVNVVEIPHDLPIFFLQPGWFVWDF